MQEGLVKSAEPTTRAFQAPVAHRGGGLADYAVNLSRARGMAGDALVFGLSDNIDALLKATDCGADQQGLVAAEPFLAAVADAFIATGVTISVDCGAALRLALSELIPLGVITSEAITNAVRHAFPVGRDGRLWIKLAQEGRRVCLTIRDNGFGIPDEDADHPGGRQLIALLARRLGGQARFGSVLFGGGLVTVTYHR